MKGLIFDIVRYTIHDGPGIRTTVFMKGCPMQCWWCHNPESRHREPETVRHAMTLDDNVFESEEVTGKWMDEKEVMDIISRDIVFYEESGGGVTFSGGEPLMQPVFLEEMLTACHAGNIATALDTSGFAPEKVLKRISKIAGLFLYDLKLMDETEHIKYTGVSNDLILKNLAFLANEGCDIRIRIPLIPGITDTEKNLNMMADFLTGLPGTDTIDLLPYHDIAQSKYRKLNMPYRLQDIPQLTTERLEEIRKHFSALNFKTNIGG
jgi:pyruvate formate lyase activating enzyme